MNLLVGDPLPVAVQLYDGATNKFVRAWIRDQGGALVGASPYAVPHLAGGLYELTGLFMPLAEFVTIQFKIYDDAGFTTPSTQHSDALDIFGRAQDTSPKVTGILDGTVEATELEGDVAAAQNLTGEVESDPSIQC